jgi:hypothetical protein
VGADNFRWIVDAVAEMAVERALEPKGAALPYNWWKFLAGQSSKAHGD